MIYIPSITKTNSALWKSCFIIIKLPATRFIDAPPLGKAWSDPIYPINWPVVIAGYGFLTFVMIADAVWMYKSVIEVRAFWNIIVFAIIVQLNVAIL